MNKRQKQIAKRQHKPSMADMIAKVIVILILGGMYICLALVALDEAADYDFADNNMTRYTSGCDEYYYTKKYGQLLGYMKLYDLYKPEFDKYWEIVDGYGDFLQYEQYERAEEMGMEGASEQVAYYKEKLAENAKNCKFPENQERLDEFVSEVQ